MQMADEIAGSQRRGEPIPEQTGNRGIPLAFPPAFLYPSLTTRTASHFPEERVMRLTTVLSGAAAAVCLVAAAHAQSVVTLYPTADAHTRDVAPNENNGPSETLWIGRGSFWGLGNIRTFVHFDLLDLLPGNPNVIVSATLSAYQFDSELAAGGLDTNVHHVLANWGENTVTWANQPPFDPQVWATAQTGSSGHRGWIDWNVTTLVQDQIDRQLHFGWMFKNTFESAGASRLGYFHSREYGVDPSRRIQLNVEIPAGDAPVMTLSYDSLRGGSNATFTATGAAPGQRVYFIYSLAGLGEQRIGQLGVTLGLRNPASAGDAVADGGGRAVLTRRVPPGASGRGVWVQAAHSGSVSNIVARVVE